MQSSLSVKANDDPCDDVVLAPDVAHVVPSEEEISSVLHLAARNRHDARISVVPEIAAAPTDQPADAIVHPVSPRDMLASDDREAHHVAPPIDAVVRPAPANDIGQPPARRRNGGRIARAFLALLCTLIIGLAAATWKSYGDGASKLIVGLVTQPVVASSQLAQSEKSDATVQPPPAIVRAEATTAVADQPAPAAPPAQPAPTAPVSVAPAVSDSTEQLQSMTTELAALRQQVEDLKTDLAQMKASQQASHTPARTPAPPARAKSAKLPPQPVTAPLHRATPPPPSYPPRQAASAQPAVPQVATAPYRSAPQAAALPPPASAPYYGQPQRYIPPPPPELPPQATAEPVDQEYRDSWTPRPPMPVR